MDLFYYIYKALYSLFSLQLMLVIHSLITTITSIATVYGKNFEEKIAMVFHDFLLNHETFTVNYGLLIDNIRLQACMLRQKFFMNNHFLFQP